MHERRPPALGWSDLRGARVGLWGIGTEARASLRRLRASGVEPVLVDDRPGDEQADLGEVLATDVGGLEALGGCEVVVASPGISRYRDDLVTLERSGVAITGGLALWLREVDRERVVCVTGTKGKSTTTSIAGHLAGKLGRRVFVGGNLGTPPYDPDAPADVDLWVIEVSSYQATDLTVAPPVVAVTSLSSDHLHWHGDIDTYVRDKLSLTTHPGVRVTVVSGEDAQLRASAAALGGRLAWVHAVDPAPAWVDALGLRGRHNVVNALVAQRCLVEAGLEAAGDDERLASLAAGFDGLDSRLRTVAQVGDVEFVDDSLSTNVLSTLAALETFAGRPVALLAGGQDRHIDYGPLGQALAARAEPTLLVALPTTGPRIVAATADAVDVAAAAGAGAGHLDVEVVEGDDGARWLADAVGRGHRWASGRNGVVLLSPAAASFDHFRDFRHRGEVFSAAARELGAG